MSLNRIIFTGDMLRPSADGSASNQKVNINWLYHLLSAPIQAGIDVEIQVLNWDDKKNSFDSRLFYELNGSKSLPEDWIRLYQRTDYNKKALDYFGTFFEQALVIGFELPDIFMHMLERLDIPYIDIVNHPIRFMDDVFFGIKTNHPAIFKHLSAYCMNEKTYKLYAGVHRATVSRMRPIRIPSDSALFTGQVEIDKSLIDNDRVLNILDFQEKFRNMANRHEKVYYKKHPYAKPDQKIDQFLKEFKNIEPITNNFYFLLGQENLSKVYSISSSTVYEAKMWGKEGEYFHKNAINLYNPSDIGSTHASYVSVYEDYFKPEFWMDILQDVFITDKSAQNILYPFPKTNRLRNSLQHYWGYNFIDTDILFKNSDVIMEKREIVKKFHDVHNEMNGLISNIKQGISGIHGETPVMKLLDSMHDSVRNKRNELESSTRDGNIQTPLPAVSIDQKREYRIEDFFAYKSIQFAENAIKSILKREPTKTELEFYTFALRNQEIKKIEILSNLVRSDEAKPHGVKIRGFKTRLFLSRFYALLKSFS